MKILLTNDDGIHAPGLAAMHAALDVNPRWNDGLAPNTKNWLGKGHERLPRGTVGLFDADGTLVRRPEDDWLDQPPVDFETFHML